MEFIYLITNKQNSKVYVGRTCKFEYRKKLHINNLKANRHPNLLLQNDFNKFGESAFEFEIIEKSDTGFGNTYIEREWMIKLKTYNQEFGYNYKDPCFMHRGNEPTKLYKLLMKGIK